MVLAVQVLLVALLVATAVVESAVETPDDALPPTPALRGPAGIKTDAARRMQRIRDKAPFRLLISIGGAGAQQEFIIQVLGALHAVQVKTAVRFTVAVPHACRPRAASPGPISR